MIKSDAEVSHRTADLFVHITRVERTDHVTMSARTDSKSSEHSDLTPGLRRIVLPPRKAAAFASILTRSYASYAWQTAEWGAQIPEKNAESPLSVKHSVE
jgi:hypothetical protein